MSKPVLTLEARGGPAFPLNVETMSDCEGMSLHDWFAGQYLAGNGWRNGTLESHVEDAFRAADLALASRLRAVSQP